MIIVNETRPQAKGGIKLAMALNTIFIPMSVPHFKLQWKIHKVLSHWVRPSLVYSLFPITTCINFLVALQNNYLIIDHVNALLV